MIRLILLLCTLSIPCLTSQGQIFVYHEKDGVVFTSIDTYSPGQTGTYQKTTYLGSPFLTYPVWQKGQVRLDMSGKAISCQLAYNINTNEVLCRFKGDSTMKTITPEMFSFNGTEYLRKRGDVAGMDYQVYFSVIHNGSTKLLRSLSSQLEPLNSAEEISIRHYKDLNVRGTYRVLTKYYIQKGDATPRLITLSKKSLLDVFADQSAALDAKIPSRQLTTTDVVDMINAYDSLVTVARENAGHLSKEEVFRKNLERKINYPAWVGNQGIYGRVYAGFDVDSLGIIKHVVILSPDNIGFGFIFEVKRALETLSNVDPNFRGAYALPIAFTFTNSREKSGPHVPINRLPDNRYQNRILLEEVTVPFVVAKSAAAPREVWGYYK
ncbi:hypothetical protein GCM10028818_60880 [Spirosoma horti]